MTKIQSKSSLKPNSKPSKRKEIEKLSSDSEPTSDEDSDQDQEINQQLLDVLAQRTLSFLALDEPSTSNQTTSKRKRKELKDEDEEWTGIDDETIPLDDDLEDDQDTDQSESEGYSDLGESDRDDELDDGEDLLKTSCKVSKPPEDAEVIVFQDPSRSAPVNHDLVSLNSDRKSFMASLLKKQNAPVIADAKNNKKSSKEDSEEAHLRSLDRSLANLITTLSAPKSKAIQLDAILSTDLPPPLNPAKAARHPRRVRQELARAELRRSQAADREATMGNIVRASSSKTTTKRQKRMEDGTEDRERRERRARLDRGIGKGNGGMIKLSAREVKMVSKGDGFSSRGKSSGKRR
ncbi:uncharacterized protein MELLADRAFT_107299 [Melampsora larici-populina 98AG31]|uniref:Uncharacterized protein n=1 Tax=Melampsora larici-populina (strain 98AG31 / pathotype 3-4-7) TaxID=747676 RepID=F4RNV6_MELLP|nr:uncharacterized protein MELLADRAFT_107299 [Melampsora larici-populina 98AG31]EGG05812.1 hypothetical protein MELLADRAFT_107299 [Melampsora larici-populina 98AG31]